MDKIKAQDIVDALGKVFSDKPFLHFTSPFELLVAVILSAQCTDERVNKITEKLFLKYNTPEKMIALSRSELEKYIFSCGLYRAKAEHILSATKDILEKFDGEVPNNLSDLQTLSGVGRKTANVVYSVAFNGNAIAVDTHVFRVSNRIGLSDGNNVLKVENDLMSVLDESVWSKTHHYLIRLGRSFCSARKPLCNDCPIGHLCEKNLKRK